MAAALTAAAGGGLAKRATCSSASAFLVAVAAAAFGQFQVSAVEVFTVTEYFVENGTDAKLSCTFISTEEIGAIASVTWTFKPLGSTAHPLTLFYYSDGKAYPGKDSQFKGRVTWAGDFNRKDASIQVAGMTAADNGTYFCDVKNPPDIVVEPGQIEVKVLERRTTTTTTTATTTTTTTNSELTMSIATSATTMPAAKMARSRVTPLFSFLPFPFKFCCILVSFFLF